MEKKIIAFNISSASARPVLSQLHAIELSAMDIQNALCTVLSIDMVEPYDLLDRELSAQKIVELLQDFDFRVFHPEILAEIVLDPGILPDGTTRLLTEKTAKVKGEVWRAHKNDADPWPSNPHAHNLETGIKLHLGTGEMFDSNRHSVGKLKKKKLKAVRKKLGDISLPELEV